MNDLFKYPVKWLLPLPFAFWVGELPTIGWLGFVFLYALIRRMYAGDFTFKKKSLFIAGFVIAYVAITLGRFEGKWDQWMKFGALDPMFLLLQAIQFFVLWILIDLLGRPSREQVVAYIRYMIWILILTIVVESVATNVFRVPPAFFPGYRFVFTYQAEAGGYQRPFGLTGVAPINGSMLVVFLWFYFGVTNLSSRAQLRWHLLVFVVLLINSSGQAMVSYFLSLIIYNFRFKAKYLLLLVPIVVGIHYVMATQALGFKISYAYIEYNLQYLGIEWIVQLIDWKSFLFGAMTNITDLNDVIIEFYFAFSVAYFGFILTVFLWCLILSPAANKPIKVGLLAALVGSLHYATILYIPFQVPLAFVLVNLKCVSKNGDVSAISARAIEIPV